MIQLYLRDNCKPLLKTILLHTVVHKMVPVFVKPNFHKSNINRSDQTLFSLCNLWLKNSPFTITLPRASLNVNTSIKRTVIKKNLTMTSCNNDIAAICLTGANQSLDQKICAFLGQHSWYTTIPFFKIWTDYLLMI